MCCSLYFHQREETFNPASVYWKSSLQKRSSNVKEQFMLSCMLQCSYILHFVGLLLQLMIFFFFLFLVTGWDPLTAGKLHTKINYWKVLLPITICCHCWTLILPSNFFCIFLNLINGKKKKNLMNSQTNKSELLLESTSVYSINTFLPSLPPHPNALSQYASHL